MKPLISVIVPVYNAEKFLGRCVESLRAQTLKNIEIILIDDGSTDDSANLAEEFAGADYRIKCIHKENGGLSSARNAGLDIAEGEYVGFVDSDDWVKKDMFEKLYNSASKCCTDVTMCGFYRVTESGVASENHLTLRDELYDSRNKIDDILITMVGPDSFSKDEVSIEMCVWRNIYKHALIKRLQLRFESERTYISEDILFNIEAYCNAGRVSIVKDLLYYYTINTQSLTQIYRGDRFSKECILHEYLKVKLKSHKLYDQCKERLNRLFIGRSRVCIIKEARDNICASIRVRIKNIKEITKSDVLVKILENYPIHRYPLKLWLVAYCMKYKLATALFLVSYKHKRR